jgi:hypothetical protein
MPFACYKFQAEKIGETTGTSNKNITNTGTSNTGTGNKNITNTSDQANKTTLSIFSTFP